MAYPSRISFTVQTLVPSVKNGDIRSLDKEGEPVTTELVNPFEYYSQLLKHLKWIATDAPFDKLKEFADSASQSLTDWGSDYSRYALYLLQTSTNDEKRESWFDSDLSNLLKADDFFYPCFYDNSYHNLDWYAIGKCEIRILKELPEYAYQIQHLWFFQDLVEVYYNIGGCLHEIIAEAYRIMGWKWFAYDAENDPILFRWAMLGGLSLRKTGGEQDRQTAKTDLFDIYENMRLAFGTRSDHPIVNGLLPEVRNVITNFDEDVIEKMVKEMSALKDENLKLTEDKTKLEKTVAELKKQIESIQKSKPLSLSNPEAGTVEKVEKILQRIYSFTNPIPELKRVSSRIQNLNRIWTDLTQETQKDIVSSVILFEQNIAIDIATLPLLRSLEREFTSHIFRPFTEYRDFGKLRQSDCYSPRYATTHKVLAMRSNIFPTLGSIPYIGRLVNDRQAENSSDLIKHFLGFINPVSGEFKKICEDLENYRLGVNSLKIVDLRNAIAHGKEEVTQYIDSSIFEAILNVLYCPPVELIVRIVSISRFKQ